MDRYYALQPGRPNGAKRLIVLLPAELRPLLGGDWIERIGADASVVWRCASAPPELAEDLEAHEYAWMP